MVVCPNPKCQRHFKDPVLLTIHSVTPQKQYDACPYCFAKIEPEPQIEQEDAPEPVVEQNVVPEPVIEQEEAMEPEEHEETADNPSGNTVIEKVKDSGPRFLKKVKALIPGSGGLKKDKKQKTEEPEPVVKEEQVLTDEPEIDDSFKETEPKPAPSANKEELKSGCPETFGYLANRPKDIPIPQGCLVCPKMVDCMLSPRND